MNGQGLVVVIFLLLAALIAILLGVEMFGGGL